MSHDSHAKKSLTIVGVGITSLMVAFRLLESKYKITIYTKGPDPRIHQDSEQYSSTGNGRMGRFVTGFEGEPYLSDTIMYPDMQWAFQHPITEWGRLAKSLNEFSSQEQEWLQKRREATLNQDAVKKLFEEYYVAHNKESIIARQNLYKDYPFLFDHTDITNPQEGVLRIYDNKNLFDSIIESHTKYGFLKEILSLDEIALRFPIYKEATEKGLIAGAIIAEGFSLNILAFVDNMINYLEIQGVLFVWNTDIEKIDIDTESIVQGLVTKDGKRIISDHYSINPGAYAMWLLDNTPAKWKIGGVAWRWIIMPRPAWYDIPTKIHGDKRPWFPVTDNNFTPFTQNGERMIAVGGWYVYVWDGKENYDSVYAIVDAENERTIELYFWEFYKSAKEKEEIKVRHNACIRSFTYDDKPVHEVMKTADGGYLTITTGTNTGTTTIAPYLAEWTKGALENWLSINL